MNVLLNYQVRGCCTKVGAYRNRIKREKLRIEDALNATRAAVEEGIVSGGEPPERSK